MPAEERTEEAYGKLKRRGFLLIVVALVAVLMLSAPMAEARHKRQPDTKCTGPVEGEIGGSGDARIAQTFRAKHSGKLTVAQVSVRKDANTDHDYILEISPTDIAGKPTDSPMALQAVPESSVPTGQSSTVKAHFSSPATVVAGTEYALIVTRPGSGIVADGRTPDTCAGNAFLSNGQTGEFSVEFNFDLLYSTFVSA
jgi:hypothetical protein